MTSYHNLLMEPIWDLQFFFYRVTRHFNSSSRLSNEFETIKDHDGFPYAVELFDFDLKLLDEPETRPENLKAPMEKLIKVIKKCSRKNWNVPMLYDNSENSVVLDLVENIFCPLHQSRKKNTSLLF